MVFVLVGRPSSADEDVLKGARRARVPVVCLAAGPAFDGYVPHVLATDVIRARPGEGFPVDELARALAQRLGEAATFLESALKAMGTDPWPLASIKELSHSEEECECRREVLFWKLSHGFLHGRVGASKLSLAGAR